jgi:hypothetical protein
MGVFVLHSRFVATNSPNAASARSKAVTTRAKGAQFFSALAGYDPVYCLEYRLRVWQVCEQD